MAPIWPERTCNGRMTELGMEWSMRFWGRDFAVSVNVPHWVAFERQVSDRLRAGEGFSLATLNLDHLVKLRTDARFRNAYAAQDFVVADGHPIVWLSMLAGRRVDRIPGSDAILPLARIAAAHRKTIALVGSTEDSLRASKAYIEGNVPGIRIVATIAPPMGFDPVGPSADLVLKDIEASGADMVLLALGAPKQELFATYGREKLEDVGFVSIGAGLDFFSGAQVRAPEWMQRMALEWLWRTLQQPGRMIPRYAKCFAILPVEIAHALRLRSAALSEQPAQER